MFKESFQTSNSMASTSGETSLSRYLRSVQEGNKYHIKRSTISTTAPTTPTPGSAQAYKPKTPGYGRFDTSKPASKSNNRLTIPSPFVSPPPSPSKASSNSQSSTEFKQLTSQIQELSEDFRLQFQQVTDKLDHLNENMEELIQCNHEMRIDLQCGRAVKIYPNAQRFSKPTNNKEYVKSLIATTCFVTPIMVFLIDYSSSQKF